MKVAHDMRVFDVVGVFIPVALELNLLVPTFFSLHYVARALGFDADLELRAVVGGGGHDPQLFCQRHHE